MTHYPPSLLRLLPAALAAALLLPAWGQRYPISPAQDATARQVAQAGVPLSELAPDAPDRYTVRAGDTLWDISALFLRSPWRWPELWGMNLEEIRNPHLIYPGQTLLLVRRDGRATLRLGSASGAPADLRTVRLSPRVRTQALDPALSTLDTRVIEPFLAEPLIVEAGELARAPRIVATTNESRILLTRGDRAYARSPDDATLLDPGDKPVLLRVLRSPQPLKDPVSGEVLGYEARFVGQARLVRGETRQTLPDGRDAIVPATLDIVSAKEEMLTGDRLLPTPERGYLSYVPHAPAGDIDGRIVSIYGSAVANAAQNQVVVINRGRRDGLESGHVLAILKNGRQLADKTDPQRPMLKLPDERNGLLMVFLTFEKLSYALVLDITDGVRIGDRLTTPR